MRACWKILSILSVALGGCSLPAPYQTYSPGMVAAPPPSSALVVYGATTTTRDMVPNSGEVEPVPVATPAPVQKSAGVSICYNRLWNSPQLVKSAALAACGGGKISPRVVSQGIDLDACPLLVPSKAVFACGTPASP